MIKHTLKLSLKPTSLKTLRLLSECLRARDLWGGKLLKPIKWGFLENQRSFLMPNPELLLACLLTLLLPHTFYLGHFPVICLLK